MKINVIENEKDRLKVELHDNMTFANLLNDFIWNQKGVVYSSAVADHPYLSHPVLAVKGSGPRKLVLDAAQEIIADVKELKSQLKNIRQ